MKAQSVEEGANEREREREKERKDMKHITGMFELLQEGGPTTKEGKRGLPHARHGRQQRPRHRHRRRHRYCIQMCLCPVTGSRKHTSEDCASRRRINMTSLNDDDPLVFALDDESVYAGQLEPLLTMDESVRGPTPAPTAAPRQQTVQRNSFWPFLQRYFLG